MAGLNGFTVIPAVGDENMPDSLSPEDTVCGLALNKCREVQAKAGPGDVVIAADTLVCLEGKLLGKPRDKSHALDMLLSMSGKKHTVYTGVSVARDNETICEFEATDVYFREISRDECKSYVATQEPMDKAGAYGAQGKGSVFIRRIDGDYYNVVGLPLCKTWSMLSKMGVSLDWLTDTP